MLLAQLAVLACSAAVGSAVWTGPLAGGLPASQFPAGVSPQACPNYPNCNNPALAANPSAPAPYNSAPQYNPYQGAPQYNAYNPSPVPQYNPGLQSALDSGVYTGDGDYRGEGLAESGAYGNTGQQGAYNQGYNAAPAYNQGYNQGLPHGVPAQIPAGVDARSCPNYPFCHA